MAQSISLWEKLSDYGDKLNTLFQVVKGIMPGGEFQMSNVEIKGVTVKAFKHLPAAIGHYVRPFFVKYADRTWVVYEAERYTFADGAKIIDAVAAALASEFDVRPGDKVGIAMRNLPEFLFTFVAAQQVGAVAVPLNALWKTAELEYAVKDSGAKVLVVDPERLELCQPFLGGMPAVRTVLCRSDAAAAQAKGSTAWQELLSHGEGKPLPNLDAITPEDEAMIMYTSGSTGFPKGVCHTQRSLGTGIKVGDLAAKMIPDPDSRALMAVPLFHITALLPIFLWSIPQGSCIIMMRKWDAGEALKIVETEKVSRFTGVPTMMRDMLDHPEYDIKRVASLKNMVAGGAPMPPAQLQQARDKAQTVQMVQGYGLTETMAMGATNRGVDYLKRPGSTGRPLPLLMDIKIKDPETGKIVPDGQRGEVCLKSVLIMKGYHNKPEETKKAIDKDGYFHSGDVGKMEGGFLYILDRLKDLIIRGGENIDCSEVEAAFYTHPAVRECSVFGLPDERLGEVVGAAVWVTADVPQAELSAHVAKSLASFKVPEPKNIFLHSTELPKGATGKLDKKGLREHYKKQAANAPQSKL